jgi:hypothetical protein
MILLSPDVISRLVQSATKALPFFGSSLGFIALLYDWGDKMLSTSLNYAIANVSAIDTSAFSNASFATVAGIGYANAVFPLEEFINIWVAVFTAAAIVLMIRWIKSFIPTVAN